MTQRFLTIEPEWLPAQGVTSAELAATWCRLTITVDGRVVTRVDDLLANSTRNAIFCSAYPLAEWIATHWWFLRSHVRAAGALDRLPSSINFAAHSGANGAASHDMRTAGDGFLWPRLLIVPEGRRTLLAWTADEFPQAGLLRFVADGRAWGRPVEVQASLSSLVDTVIDRLHEVGITDTLLEDEWRAILAADEQEASFCDAAAALGLDPYDMDEQTAKSIEGLGAALGQELVVELAAAADPQRLREDLDWVTHSLKRISHKPGAARGVLAKLRALHLRDDDSGPPWELGWRHAKTVRKVLRVADSEPFGFDGMFDHRHSASGDGALQALASGVSGRIEVVLGIRAGVAGQRFVDGRALWRSLHTEDRPYLLTTANTFEQRVERAFAAELLAPAMGIAKIIDTRSGVALATDVERAARRFKVSPVVVGHQLENQLGLTIAG